jgi:hypothetical protein
MAQVADCCALQRPDPQAVGAILTAMASAVT